MVNVNNTVFLFIVAPSDSVTHCHHAAALLLAACCCCRAAARVTTTAANARAKAIPSVQLG